MKKLVAIMIVICFMFTFLVACGGAPTTSSDTQKTDAKTTTEDTKTDSAKVVKDGKKLLIGLSFGTLQEERWQREKEYCFKKAEELGVDIVAQDANLDSNLQNSQVENLIAQGIDALILGANDIDAAVTAVEMAKKAGIPVIGYLRLVNSTKMDAYVGFDFVKIGESMAENAIKNVPKGNYVIVQGDPGDNAPPNLTKGIMNKLQPYIDKGDIKVVYNQNITQWVPEKAMAAMEDCLTVNNNDIQAALVHNDGLSGGVIRALAAQKLDGKVYVSGMDADVAGLQRIVEGTQYGTILFPHEVVANAAVEAAVKLAKKESIESMIGGKEKLINGSGEVPSIVCDFKYISKENIKEDIIDAGILPMDQVYKNIPKDQWPK